MRNGKKPFCVVFGIFENTHGGILTAVTDESMAAVVEKIKYRNEDNGYSVLSVTAPTTGKNIFWSAISLIFRKGNWWSGRPHDRTSDLRGAACGGEL